MNLDSDSGQNIDSKFFPVGKIEPRFLEDLISSIPEDKRVIVGPQVGEDAAVVDFGANYLVIKTDPITFTSENIGWYVVNINANDLACMGATPRWLLVTLLLPSRTTKELVRDVFDQITSACRKLGISLVGGHVEVTHNLDRTLAVGNMVGEVPRDRLIRSSGAKVGDVIVLSKGIAIEGTHVIYQKKKEELEKRLPAAMLRKIRDLIYEPGISVVKEALLASQRVKIHSMHDPTEGGLKSGLWELAHASRVGVRVEKEKIAVLEETKKVCELYELDPLGLLASGSLILTLDRKEAERLSRIYTQRGIRHSIIGEITPPEEGMKIIQKRQEFELVVDNNDEISKLL